ncbi:uncharacterized protein Tco025E_09617 [Trypanosoma conorhini]|uniref:Uncharacterized protein n=1 Tax=Trypanosoma conorhini TaxID=83891 RepID=A0A3R7LGI3_9TRYP|nr:uncharacterized protein Tco025E_09617 [Trypanosoma conorhini]RNE96847.1 hypothetical protein Tco025E_09617 [Trypanosoma conorhini]
MCCRSGHSLARALAAQLGTDSFPTDGDAGHRGAASAAAACALAPRWTAARYSKRATNSPRQQGGASRSRAAVCACLRLHRWAPAHRRRAAYPNARQRCSAPRQEGRIYACATVRFISAPGRAAARDSSTPVARAVLAFPAAYRGREWTPRQLNGNGHSRGVQKPLQTKAACLRGEAAAPHAKESIFLARRLAYHETPRLRESRRIPPRPPQTGAGTPLRAAAPWPRGAATRAPRLPGAALRPNKSRQVEAGGSLSASCPVGGGGGCWWRAAAPDDVGPAGRSVVACGIAGGAGAVPSSAFTPCLVSVD